MSGNIKFDKTYITHTRARAYWEAQKAGEGKDAKESGATASNNTLEREVEFTLTATLGMGVNGGGTDRWMIEGATRAGSTTKTTWEREGGQGSWLENPRDGKCQAGAPLCRHVGKEFGSGGNKRGGMHNSRASGYGGRSHHGEQQANGGQTDRPGRIGTIKRDRVLRSGYESSG